MKAITFAYMFCLTQFIYATPMQDKLNLVIHTMNICYENENKVGVDLAKCMLEKFEKMDNPQGYRVNVTDENPSKVIPHAITISIYNKYGQMIICNGTAQAKIVINNCTEQQKQPLNAGQELSITPPN
ncbi:Uncharacterised protein (plasmid) [Legionella adelaidensis]|uniref:Uncharacterized protein n=1 Tax=Legionella adelaidensis TaxID=45056 RepID=A0A0W0R1Z5_9GAMM|nr:hypothetical protein [Legionella adelaidensis]KTC65050.1 hypothetical protein Lade_1573 [Legionella adelaidensis]VEH85431.1 Uncharacterised protein [Legionella adelaidensis]